MIVPHEVGLLGPKCNFWRQQKLEKLCRELEGREEASLNLEKVGRAHGYGSPS